MKKSIFSSCTAVMLASLLMISGGALFSSSAMAAKVCKDASETEEAIGTKKGAERRAIRQWVRKVENKFGGKWDNWFEADNKNLWCERTSNFAVRWKCTSMAWPCKD